MKIEVAFTPAELAGIDLGDRVVVVLDVLRATSTIVEALANGARAVSPVSTVDEAVRLAEALGREGVLLAGERRSLRIDGFDMGNSPLEFTRERVSGKQIVLTTTNGTVAILASATARRVLIASYLNLGAVAEELVHDGGPASIVCSGRERRFALEDALCAGALVRRVSERTNGALELNDAARAAVDLFAAYGADLAGAFARTAAGRQLIDAGLEADLEYCTRTDVHAVVPELRDRQIIS